MTDEAKAVAKRLRQVSSVLFDDYGDGTHAVEDYALAGKAADLIETQARANERLRETLKRSGEGWENAIELGLIPERHRNTAQILAEEARAALAGDSHD